MADNLLSKVKIGSTTYNLKDAAARGDIATLLGGETIKALGSAAWRAVAASISDGDGKIADAATVKAYVDAQIGQIKPFDVIVCAAEAAKIPAGAEYRDGTTVITGTMAASADTMYKIYLVKNSNAGAGAYTEWISIKKGEGSEAVFSWECIGSTAVDLSNYVQKSRKIAGITLENDITVAALQEALGLEDLAYASTASGDFTPAGTVSVGDFTPAGSVSVDLSQAETAADLTKTDYTPAGNITGSAISGGSINVTIKDADTATAVTDLAFENYTPEGSVAAPAITVSLASKSVQFVESVGALPSFTEGAFTAATIDASKFFNAGSVALGTFNAGSMPTLGEATTSSFAQKVLKPAVDTTDAECLVFNWVDATGAGESTAFATAVTAQGTLSGGAVPTWSGSSVTAPSIDVANGFNGGSKAADTWSAGALPSLGASETMINGLTSAFASAPAFTGVASAIKLSGAKYLKQEISAATFSGVSATLGFSGSTFASGIVTGVKYSKAAFSSATFTGTAGSISATFAGTAGSVIVTPDVE